MRVDSLPLLHQLAMEYNELVISPMIPTAPPDDDHGGADLSNLCSTVTDEADMEVEEVEMEMIGLLTIESSKRNFTDCSPINSQKGKKRGKYNMSKMVFTNPYTLERVKFTFVFSIWYMNYIIAPQSDDEKWCKKFRNRFRMPYPSYLYLVSRCQESEYFAQWDDGVTRYRGRRRTPISLLVLTALRYLGRGWTCDDLEESTGVSMETIRLFLLQFIKFGSTTLYNEYVQKPITQDELASCEREFLMAGFPGCVGSSDATHVIMERCPFRLRQLHLGYKLAHTARTYNMTVNHRRRILSTTTGHPSRFNDKTLVLFDDFVQSIHNNQYGDRFQFVLRDFNADGEIVDVGYRGCYLIVDNGYLKWSVTVPPIKDCNTRREARFSEWLESLRKDVECAFGILKKRWQILKTGIRFHGILNCDMVWLTCCALHNYLLDVDGLSEVWNSGIDCDYDTDDGSETVPFAIRKLIDPNCVRTGDYSGVGRGSDCVSDSDSASDHDDGDDLITDAIPNTDGSLNVTDLSLSYFRNKLITHFNISFSENKVRWPTRNRCN